MATKVAIAKMRENAMRRLTAAMETIGKSTNVETIELPTHNRDADYLQAEQLDTMANWLESVAKAKSGQSQSISDEAFAAELRRRMADDGIEVGKSLKADLEAFLELHSAGADDPDEEPEDESEDELGDQASADGESESMPEDEPDEESDDDEPDEQPD